MIDPNEFVITRKRKKYKFAKFANSPLCFEFEEWQKQPIDVIELGAGTALFLVELASRYPEKSFVAVDVKADRLQKGAYEAAECGLTNIRFLRARADQLLDCFETGKTAAIWLTFPDPFPRARSAGRRMTHPTFLKIYRQLLAKKPTHPQGLTLNRGEKSEFVFSGFYLKHDNLDFFQWSLEQLVAENWHLKELSFDLHESDLADDYKILTSYETRWLTEGLSTNFVKAQP